MPAKPTERIIEFGGRRYIHITKLCEMLDCSKPLIQRMIKSGQIRCAKLNSLTFIPESDIMDLLEGKRNENSTSEKSKGLKK
jgi:excisionase family DNA binding protein